MKDTIKQRILELVPDAKEDFGLAVVLRAIGQMVQGKRHIVVNMIGGFAEYKSANGEMGLWMLAGGHMWNLEHDNYDDQDRPTQLFIGSLLGV